MIGLIIIFSIISFAIGYALLPGLVKSLVKSGYFGRDVHKINKPKVAEPGGIILIFSFIISIFLYLGFITYSNGLVIPDLFAGILAVLLAGIIGLVDDFLKLSWKTSFIIMFLPALPLMVLKAGVSEINVPLIGYVDFGILYSLILIPLMVNFVINEFNMVAGYNGLETGMALISMVTIILACIMSNQVDIAVLVSCMLGGAVALFLFNKYPAKVFIGDTGTYMLGALMITAIILANMEKLALGIFFLYFLDFAGFLICLKKGCRVKFASIDSQERLHPSCGHRIYFALPYLFPKWNLGEKHITKILLGVQALICALSLIVFF